ncbi:hypothetical protein DFP72DRAFT_1072523 [Ephemerocybe angulata]|uniref:Uncharacterized protein n=1 Tax=Ephemerocybe angulata TaxID=980116 RepID=A0A8H6M3G9_9AGAR|nr:hypothetical protein DFP72DRAFT_1072523 [Tulosesus angulatus]
MSIVSCPLDVPTLESAVLLAVASLYGPLSLPWWFRLSSSTILRGVVHHVGPSKMSLPALNAFLGKAGRSCRRPATLATSSVDAKPQRCFLSSMPSPFDQPGPHRFSASSQLAYHRNLPVVYLILADGILFAISLVPALTYRPHLAYILRTESLTTA